MPKILYWNVRQKGIDFLESIATLAKDNDILVLAELEKSKKDMVAEGLTLESLILAIEAETGMKFIHEKKQSWLYTWVRESPQMELELVSVYDSLRKIEDLTNKEFLPDSEHFAAYLSKYDRMRFFKLKYKTTELLLVAIHFPSRLYASIAKQKDISVHFKNFIETIEESTGLSSIVFGDFNMNPYEPGMIHQEGFHALPARNVTETKAYYGKPYSAFYNPSWGKHGDFEIDNAVYRQKPAGSYFFAQSSDLNLYWYVFDQVILRIDLAPLFNFHSFKYLTGAKSENEFLNADMTPNATNFSDHLPITFELL